MLLTYVAAIGSDAARSKAERLYVLYRGTMLHVALGVLGDMQLAEDAVSEAFIKIIKHMDKIDEVDCYRTRGFVVIIVRNTARDILRTRTRGREVPYEEYQPEIESAEPVFEEVSLKEARERIVLCIQKLNSNYSDILYLKAALGYSYEEIGQMLGITKDNAKMRLFRARAALKAELEKGDVLDGSK